MCVTFIYIQIKGICGYKVDFQIAHLRREYRDQGGGHNSLYIGGPIQWNDHLWRFKTDLSTDQVPPDPFYVERNGFWKMLDWNITAAIELKKNRETEIG